MTTSIDLNTNVLSLTLQNNLAKTTRALMASMEKLSTGNKINHASDGAAQLALSTKLTSQISGTAIAQDNVQQGMLALNQADSAFQSISANLTKIRDLAVQASQETYSQDQRDAMKLEAQGYLNQIDTIATGTSFNGINLLDGTLSSLKLQVGANSGDVMDISNAFVNAQGSTMGLTAAALTTAFSSATNANAFIATVDSAITQTSSNLSTVGATSNSLNSVLDNLAIKQTNMEASKSLIMDVDYASEISKYVQLQILQQTNVSLLSQANLQPSIALNLLNG